MRELEAKTRETLERQLQLLSERSQNASDADLANLTYAMNDVARMLGSSVTLGMDGPKFTAKAQNGFQPDRLEGEST